MSDESRAFGHRYSKPSRNAVIVEIVKDVERPTVHIECKDEGAKPQLEELARRILFQIALR